MKTDALLDYAVFQLSPKRSRCELFVSSDGQTEKLASGLVKPFVTHLKVAEEQVALSVQSIKLEVERQRHAETWFTKGTLERFVRFVSTPETLELVSTFDAEMSQLEAAQKLYSQGMGDQLSSTGGGGSGITAASDATKKELLRAIDVRLAAVKQDLTTAYARAAAAGFNLDAVLELQTFADQFGAHRLKEACSKFISLCERRQGLIKPLKVGVEDRAVRSSYGSDMSIEEDPTTPEPQPAEIPQQSQSNPTLPKISSTFPLRQSRESSLERDVAPTESVAVVEKENKEESSSEQVEAIPASQPTRRLSVKDRISLFENQQKESSGSGGKPIVGKSVELRRQSPDVPDKAVLRRWSGVSDMSIDLSGEKKDTESPLCTPSSASASDAKSEDQGRLNSNQSAGSGKPEFKSVPGRVVDSGSRDQAEIQLQIGIASTREEILGAKPLTSSSSKSGDALGTSNSSSNLGTVDGDGLKDQTPRKSRSKFFLNQAEGNKDQANSEAQPRPLPASKTEILDLTNLGMSRGPQHLNQLSRIRGRVDSEAKFVELKDQGASQTQPKVSMSQGDGFRSISDSNQAGQAEFPNQKEELEDIPSQSQVRVPQSTAVDSGQPGGGPALGSRGSFASQSKGAEGDSTSSQPKWRFLMGTKEAQRKELALSGKLTPSSASSMEDSRPQQMKFEKQISASEQVRRVPGHIGEKTSAYGDSKTLLSGKIVLPPPEGSDSFSAPHASQVQRARQSKGNQELNDELKMKANELEKLFAEHKLRAPGDFGSNRKTRDMQIDSAAIASYHEPVADDAPSQLPTTYMMTEPARSSIYGADISATPPMKMADNPTGDALSNSFSELSISEGSRGKLYDRYMQKRNEKLREEWGSKRAEKEAKLKALQDSFERSRAEIEAKFSGSTDRQDSLSNAHRRVERLRSFSAHSYAGKEQQRLDFGQSDDDEDLADFQGHKIFGQDRSLNDAANKKLLPSKSLSSSTPKTSAAPIPKSANKSSNISSGRRKMQSENPLAQSVPNFTEMRKENTKPSSAASKTSRAPVRNYVRSKSTNDDVSNVKEEKSRRSLRKSYANPTEFMETSPLKTEDSGLALSTFDEETEQSPYNRFQKHIETKSFLRKGSGKDFSSRTSFGKQKAFMASNSFNNGEENEDVAFGSETMDILNDDDDEVEAIGNDSRVNVENRESMLSQESEKMMNSSSENGDAIRSFSHVDPSIYAKMPAVSGFHPVENHDSPEESPVSWNLGAHNPFSYSHEMSDVDASADSPIGSPVSWNSHSLSQMDAARMRKKWGTAQKPMLVTNSSNNQSSKDMTRGFKRLLKFGRKSRGTENLVDWISATTSDGDDDTEDGRDLANRSLEDLRKSRMGVSQAHPSDDSFNESEFFNEQVQSLQSSIPTPPPNFKLRDDHLSGSSIKAPRSFFSLSTFRSKGNDSKPR